MSEYILQEPYWEFVDRLFAKKNHGPDGLMHAAIGLAGEAGEVLDAMKKHWVYGKPLDRDHILEEVGDVLFYLTALCNQLNSSIADCVCGNVDKLRRRYPDGYTDAAAVARADKV